MLRPLLGLNWPPQNRWCAIDKRHWSFLRTAYQSCQGFHTYYMSAWSRQTGQRSNTAKMRKRNRVSSKISSKLCKPQDSSYRIEMRDISGKKYISEMRVQGDYLHTYPSARTQATLPSPQTRTASSVFSKTTRVLEKATEIQTTNAIKKQKPITMINRRAVFSTSASCGQQ